MLLEVHNMDIQLCCFLAGIYVCVHLFDCQNKSTCFQIFKFSDIQVFKCFLCACAANDAGRFVTGGPLQELDAKLLVLYNYMHINSAIATYHAPTIMGGVVYI